jgi:hypothetical protein
MTEGIARRSPAPRRKDYAVVDGSRGPRRDCLLFRTGLGYSAACAFGAWAVSIA